MGDARIKKKEPIASIVFHELRNIVSSGFGFIREGSI